MIWHKTQRGIKKNSRPDYRNHKHTHISMMKTASRQKKISISKTCISVWDEIYRHIIINQGVQYENRGWQTVRRLWCGAGRGGYSVYKWQVGGRIEIWGAGTLSWHLLSSFLALNMYKLLVAVLVVAAVDVCLAEVEQTDGEEGSNDWHLCFLFWRFIIVNIYIS